MNTAFKIFWLCFLVLLLGEQPARAVTLPDPGVRLDVMRRDFELMPGGALVVHLTAQITPISLVASGANPTWVVPYSASTQSIELIEAKHVMRDGSVREVARERLITHTGKSVSDPSVASDWRLLEIPLPAPNEGVLHARVRLNLLMPRADGKTSLLLVHDRSLRITSDIVTLTMPSSYPVKTAEKGFAPPRRSELPDGRARLEWSRQAADPPPAEPYELAAFETSSYIVITDYASWADMAKSFRMPPAQMPELRQIEQLTQTVVRSGKPIERVEAIRQWIASNIAYTDERLGDNGLLTPKPLALTLADRRGDCKDFSALMVAMLAAAGIEAELASTQVKPGYSVLPLPVLQAFDHMIVYVPSLDLFVDPTSKYHATGSLAANLIGKLALLTPSGRMIRTPAPRPSQDSQDVLINVMLSADGTIAGDVSISATGDAASWLRTFLDYSLSRPGLGWASQIFSKWWGTPTEASVDAPEQWRGALPLRASLKLKSKFAYTLADGRTYGIPIPTGPQLSTTMSALPKLAVRNTPFTCSTNSRSETIIVTLPGEFTFDTIPFAVHFEGKTTTYHAEYVRENNRLVVKRKLIRARTKPWCEPGEWAEAVALAEAVIADANARFVVKRKADVAPEQK